MFPTYVPYICSLHMLPTYAPYICSLQSAYSSFHIGKIKYCHKIVMPPAITINQIEPSTMVASLHKAPSHRRLGVSHLSTGSSSTESCIYVEPMAYNDTYNTPIYENQCVNVYQALQSANVYQTIQSAHCEAKQYNSLNRLMAWAPVTEEQSSQEGGTK